MTSLPVTPSNNTKWCDLLWSRLDIPWAISPFAIMAVVFVVIANIITSPGFPGPSYHLASLGDVEAIFFLI